jgi:CBS domain-containing protein
MTTSQEANNQVVCPSCGWTNVLGAETCDHCLSDLTKVNVPAYAAAEFTLEDGTFATRIGEIRLSKPATVAAEATVREAVAVLLREATGAAVVMDGRRIAGVFTERDILKRVAGDEAALDHPVSRYMTADPVVLRDTDTMAAALNKMGDGGFRHIPLTRGDELIAMVTARDVLQWLMERYFG